MHYIKKSLATLLVISFSFIQGSAVMQLTLGAQPARSEQRQKPLPRQLSTEISKAEADQVLSAAPEEVRGMVTIHNNGHWFGFDDLSDFSIYTGKPGTGKFKSALSVAHKTGMKCFAYSGDALSDGTRGSGIKNIEKIFEDAKKHSPCILIVKNLEYLIAKSKKSNNVDADMWPHLVWYLKRKHNGADRVHFIGTVDNWFQISKYHRDFLCFDRVDFNLPTIELRRKALEYHRVATEEDTSFDEKVSCEQLAAKTDGYSYRELKSVMTKAKLTAMARHSKDNKKAVVTTQDCLSAVKRVDEDFALTGKKRELVDPITLRDCMPYVLGVGVAVVALFTLYKAKPAASTATAAAK